MNYRNLSVEEIENIDKKIESLSLCDLKKEAKNSLIQKKQTSNRVSKCNKKRK